MGVSQSLSVTQVSQSVASNSSVIRIVWKSTQSGESYNNYLNTAYYTVKVNGVSSSYSVNYKLTKATTVTILDTSLTVPHNSAGECTVSVSTWMDTGISEGEIEKYQAITLTKIPRTSVPTVSATSTDMGSKVQVYTNRPSTSLTHDLAYSFAGSAYTTFATGVGDSYVWTTPDLASSIPNAASGTVTIRCTTKSGGTAIGTATVALTLKVPTSVVPTISKVTVAEATDGLAAQFGAYVQNKSTLDVSITAAGAKGSTISSYKTVIAGVTYTDQAFTSNELPTSGSVSLVTTVTDSRGRTASKTTPITVLAYEPPKTSEFRVYRCDKNGNPTDDGIYLGLFYSYSVTSLNSKNTAAMVIEYKTASGSSWATLTTGSSLSVIDSRFFSSPTFSTDYQYSFRLTVTDWFDASASYVATLSSADVILDISSDGTGLGFGKVSQRSDAVEFARVIYDRHDKRLTNGLAIYTGSGTGVAVDPNTTLEHTVLTDINTPTEAFYYVCTYFYSDKTDSNNKAQMAIPYNSTGDTFYFRYKYNGTWSAWEKPNDPLSAYPVNSIYISYSHTSPAALFGGTWTRIESRFLWGVSASSTIGGTGGAQTHTLTPTEMPAHRHTMEYSTNNGSSYSNASMGRDGKYSGAYLGFSNSVEDFTTYQVRIQSTGGGGAHNNMPPYINVSIWRRTA